MHLRRWLFATSSIINEIAGLPIPNLQQSSLSEAVLPTSKQQSNLLRRFFPERLAPNILAQANSIPDDDTISHIQNALEYLVTYPELDRRSAPMNSGKHVLQHSEISQPLRFSTLQHVTTNRIQS